MSVIRWVQPFLKTVAYASVRSALLSPLPALVSFRAVHLRNGWDSAHVPVVFSGATAQVNLDFVLEPGYECACAYIFLPDMAVTARVVLTALRGSGTCILYFECDPF